MARNESSAERPLPPTQRALQRARREGKIVVSPDVQAAGAYLVALLLLAVLGPALVDGAQRLMAVMLDSAVGGDIDYPAALAGVLWPLAGLMAGLCAAALAIGAAQTRMGFWSKRIVPDISRCSPVAGLRNMLSAAPMRLVFATAKIAAVLAVAWWTASGWLGRMCSLSAVSAGRLPGAAGHMVLQLGLRLAAVLALIAVLDWFYRRWEHRRELRMSIQEHRQELKDTEVSPAVRRRQRGSSPEVGPLASGGAVDHIEGGA